MNKKILIIGIVALVVVLAGSSFGYVYMSGMMVAPYNDYTSYEFEEENKLPTASCSASPTFGTEPLTVPFQGSGNDNDGIIESYHWDFGDGYTSIKQNPSHTFQTYGTYTVTLTVTDNNRATDSDTIRITVYQSEPEKDYDDTEFTDWLIDGMRLIADDMQEILDSSGDDAEFAFRLLERDSERLLNEIDDYDDFYSSDLLPIKSKFKSALWDFKNGGMYGQTGVKYSDADAIDISIDYLKSGVTKYEECRDLIFEYLGIFLFPLEVEE